MSEVTERLMLSKMEDPRRGYDYGQEYEYLYGSVYLPNHNRAWVVWDRSGNIHHAYDGDEMPEGTSQLEREAHAHHQAAVRAFELNGKPKDAMPTLDLTLT